MFAGPMGRVEFVWFSPDGTAIASGGRTNVYLWDVKTGEVKGSFVTPSRTGKVWFSSDWQTVAGEHPDHTIGLWDIKTGERKQTLTGHEQTDRSATFSPDGTMFASANYGDIIRLWDVKTGEVKQVWTGHKGGINDIVFSLDGKVLATVSNKGTMMLWKVH